EDLPVRGGETVEEGEHAGSRDIAAAPVLVEADGTGGERAEPRRGRGSERVGPHTVDHDEHHVEQRRPRLASEGSLRIAELAARAAGEGGGHALLARPGLV